MRPKGVMVYRSPKNPVAEEAKKEQRQKQERLAAARAARAERPVPNYICYSFLFPDYDPKTGRGAPSPLPKCKVCREAVLHPQEHHVCEGFTPMYKERTEEDHERWEARREEIRESRRGRGVYCSECNELMEDPEDAQWHREDHEGKPQREHYALCGEPDGDLEGYEDEPEDDWCDEDEDEGD